MLNTGIKIEKLQITKVPVEYQEYEGCVAFQLITYTIGFYGNEITNTLDTKILSDGTQIVTNGDGWIKCGTKIN